MARPPAPSELALDGPYAHQLIYTRGTRLHVATAGASDDPLVILLPGAWSAWFDYRDVIEPLAARGFHVAAVDLRGYGLSDRPPATRDAYDMRASCADLNGLVQALGHARATLVGADAGAAIAWSLATSRPERVAALVAIGTLHPADARRVLRRRPWRYPLAWLRRATCALPWPLLRGLVPFLPTLYTHQLSHHCTPAFRRTPRYRSHLSLRLTALRLPHALRAIVPTHRLLWDVLPDPAPVSCPTLLFHPGGRGWDATTLAAAHERLRPGTPLRVVATPGVSLPHVETPDRFVAELADFLAPS